MGSDDYAKSDGRNQDIRLVRISMQLQKWLIILGCLFIMFTLDIKIRFG